MAHKQPIAAWNILLGFLKAKKLGCLYLLSSLCCKRFVTHLYEVMW